MLKRIKKFDFVVVLGILFFLLVILIPKSVSAQDVNYAGSARNGVASQTGTTQGGTTSGAIANTNDDDHATYWKRQGYFAGAGLNQATYGEFTIEVEFEQSIPMLNNVKYWVAWYNRVEFGSACDYVRSLSTSLYYSGAWHEIGTEYYSGRLFDTGQSQSSSVDILGPWENVTKVRIRLYTSTRRAIAAGFYDIWADVTLYELEAWGSPPVVPPTVVTNDTTAVQDTSAVLNGDITGGEDASERGFEWGTSLGGPYPNSWTEPGSFGTGVFSHTITGLDSETTYYFRAKANNSAGWGYGEEKSFTTASPPPPICGNNTIEPPEVCDDNNTVDCDGCKGDCSRVDDVCGDWITECGEECDDGNLFDGDGCSSACETELPGPGPGPTCAGYNVWGWAWSENIGWISFSCSGGVSSHWQEVDDVASDDFGTYVWTDSGSEQKDAYELEDPSAVGAINQIRVKMRYQGTIKNYFRLNGVESAFPGSGSVFGAWGERTTNWEPSRPGGGVWTWNDIRDLQVVVGLSTFTFAGTTYQGRLTQIYIEVDYAGGTLILRPNNDGDYVNIDNPPAGSSVDYGVNINPATGEFSGYAWSENIGWISFEPVHVNVADCPDWPVSCQAELDLSTGAVSGWARALTYGDGWDGWIKLSGTWEDGVSISSVPAPSEFEGWAWGDDVVGWVSFNCSNTGSCVAVDYKVMTDIIIILNDPPYIEPGSANIEYEEYCDFSPIGQVAFRWTYDDNEGDDQAQYNLQVATDAGFSNLVVDVIADQSKQADSVDPSNSTGTSAVSVKQTPTSTFDIAYGDTYFWRIKVKDTAGRWSTNWESGPTNFSTPSNPYPNPSFTWNPLSPPAEVEVDFTDNSFCYTGFNNCKDDADTIYGWDFDNDSVIDKRDKGDTVFTYPITGPYTVRLGVTDIIDLIPRTCYQEEPLTATLPLPTWKEIVPF